MFNVNFWTFKKDIDSTKRPAGTPAASFSNCDIVQPFSITDPEIIVSSNNAPAWNYCYITEWSRYYFINAWTFIDGLWFGKCHVDVLATFKPDIGAEQLYILRSSAARNGYNKDNYYPMTGAEEHSDIVLSGNPVSYDAGHYVVNVVGKQTGSSTLYQMSPAEFSNFLDALLGVIDNTTATIGDYWQAIKNSIFNPMQYITSVMWFPFAFPHVSGGRVKVGLWDSGVTADVITIPEYTLTYPTIELAKHPQESRGKYLNAAPFTHYYLEYDPFGVIELDAAQLIDAASVRVKIFVDALTGAGILKVYSNEPSGACLASIQTQYGVPLPLAQSAVGSGTISGSVQTIGSAIAGAITGNAAMIAGAVSAGIDTMADAVKGATTTIGSGGSIIGLKQSKVLHASFYRVTGADNSKNGSPYMQQATPAGLGGFMIVQRGDVAINGTQTEAAEIKAKLERGFYYE